MNSDQIRYHLEMNSDDSNSSFEMAISQEEKVSYQKVPLDTLFKMKIIDGSNVRKLKYNLGKDTELPCEKVVGGKSRKCKFNLNKF